MNRPKTIISLAVFFGIIGFLMAQVGASINDPNFEYIGTVATGGQTYYQTNGTNYAHLWDNNMERMGINTFQIGEYGMTDRIYFEGVYHSTKSYGDQYASSWSDTIVGKISDFFSGKGWNTGDLDWDHGTMQTIHEGDNVYIYPHLNIDLPGGDNPFELNLKQYIFARTFDAYSMGNEWLHEPDTQDVSGGGDSVEWIPQLNCGKMGAYDLYYVIDVAYFDMDVLNSIPGLNLLTDTDIANLIKEDKARFMERWGGVIYGDEHQEGPSMLEYHELQYSQSGGINVFFDTIKNIQMGWTAFTDTGNTFIDIVFETVMGIFGLIFSVCIYYEIKSYLPFISGGEGA